MASRELVGRPLVPFFDADDNVNDALATDASRSFESLDVDARVWNRELGYFEYPSEQTASSSGGSSSGDTPASRRQPASAPIAIPQSGRVLLTPAMMLSSSCPDATPLASEQLQQQTTDESAPTARSASAKRGSKQDKGRSNTPARRRTKSSKQGATESDATPAAAAAATAVEQAADGREGKAGGRRSGRSKNKEAGKAPQQPKAKEEPSAASSAGSDKWAWSAFQSSPDPKQLPLPPFLAPPGKQNASAELLPDRPPQPTTPPEAPPMSVELSMTQDLRRLLNIGGG